MTRIYRGIAGTVERGGAAEEVAERTVGTGCQDGADLSDEETSLTQGRRAPTADKPENWKSMTKAQRRKWHLARMKKKQSGNE